MVFGHARGSFRIWGIYLQLFSCQFKVNLETLFDRRGETTALVVMIKTIQKVHESSLGYHKADTENIMNKGRQKININEWWIQSGN